MRIYVHLAITLSILTLTSGQKSRACRERTIDQNSVVCVCTEDYCDEFGPIDLNSEKGQNVVHVVESNRHGFRFHHKTVNMTQRLPYKFLDQFDVKITVNRSEKYQTVEGVGGAFTDAAGQTTYALTPKVAQKVIESYFTPNGLDYSIGRVPIGGTDFSARAYSLDDHLTDDLNLDHFTLQKEDHKYKIPMIRDAVRTSKRPIKFFASAWSAPAWMKTNGQLNGQGGLKGRPGGPYYKTWAKYYVKFLDAYKKENISFWGMTLGNEPVNGFTPNHPFNCMAMTPDEQRDWIKMDLGPLLQQAGYGRDKLKLMIMDDQRDMMPLWPTIILRDQEAAKYVDGIAFHWYENQYASANILTNIHGKFPDKFIMATEATHIASPKLGKWDLAEIYAVDIIEDFLNWNVAWMDWNLSLDPQGGPNWVSNWCDSPIIVNATSGEFYKQPHYYAMGHFSKFVPPGSKRVSHSIDTKGSKVISVSFETPDMTTTTVVVNQEEAPQTIEVLDVTTNKRFNYRVSAKSIVTFLTAN